MKSVEPRTAAATRAKVRYAEERTAAKLRSRGWKCQPPESYKSNDDIFGDLLIAVNQIRRRIDLDAWRWDKVSERDIANATEVFRWIFPSEEAVPSIDEVA